MQQLKVPQQLVYMTIRPRRPIPGSQTTGSSGCPAETGGGGATGIAHSLRRLTCTPKGGPWIPAFDDATRMALLVALPGRAHRMQAALLDWHNEKGKPLAAMTVSSSRNKASCLTSRSSPRRTHAC